MLCTVQMWLTIGGAWLVPLAGAFCEEEQAGLLPQQQGGGVCEQRAPGLHGAGVGVLSIGVDVGLAPCEVPAVRLIQQVEEQAPCVHAKSQQLTSDTSRP